MTLTYQDEKTPAAGRLWRDSSLQLKLFSLFVIIQPFLDYYFLFSEEIKRYTLISPSTIIRCLFIGVMFVCTLYARRKSKRMWIAWGIYFAVTAVYYVAHMLANAAFPYELPAFFQFTLMEETVYIIRLLLPLILLFLTFHQAFTWEHVRFITIAMALIISGTIIITNLLKVSLVAYSTEPVVNEYSFLSWFDNTDYEKFNYMTSKGWFYMANIVSGVVLLLFPLLLMYFIQKPGAVNMIALMTLSLSMLIIGTRVCLYSMVLSFVVVPGIYLIDALMHKKLVFRKHLLWLLLPVLLVVLIYPYSPYPERNQAQATRHRKHVFSGSVSEQYMEEAAQEEEKPSQEEKKEDTNAKSDAQEQTKGDTANIKKETNEQKTTENKIEELTKALQKTKMRRHFFTEYYPVSYDYDFWLRLTTTMDYADIDDPREQQKLVSDRIFEKLQDQKPVYMLLGVGHSRLATGQTVLEQDFIVQYYKLGIAGVLLFYLPYLLLISACIIHILRKFKTRFDPEMVTMLFAFVLFFAASVNSGHLIDELFPMLPLAFYLGYVCKRLFKRKEQAEG
ncbi:MAG: O-antigen ligase family protein [Christensenellales bacterium]|jgi:hypothetical protein